MRRILSGFLVICILAGFVSRAVGADPCESLLERHASEHTHHDHDSPCDPDHDRNCPVEHHKSGMCCHVMPVTLDAQALTSLGFVDYSLTPLRAEVLLCPEGPVHELDKPPLI